MKKPTPNEFERRFLKAEVRAMPLDGSEENAPTVPVIRGSAAVFNQYSENLGGFREVIKPGAFDNVLDQDVRAMFNHDANFVLGRTVSGTLKLVQTEIGLDYEITPPDSQTVKDLVLTPMARGDIDQSSFTFVVARDGERWYEDEEGLIIREITKFSRLRDVGPVSVPAYPDTTSEVSRSLESFKKQQAGPSPETLASRDSRAKQMRGLGIRTTKQT